jgi:hypothetical protein
LAIVYSVLDYAEASNCVFVTDEESLSVEQCSSSRNEVEHMVLVALPLIACPYDGNKLLNILEVSHSEVLVDCVNETGVETARLVSNEYITRMV